jgi:hypothetical protein
MNKNQSIKHKKCYSVLSRHQRISPETNFALAGVQQALLRRGVDSKASLSSWKGVYSMDCSLLIWSDLAARGMCTALVLEGIL